MRRRARSDTERDAVTEGHPRDEFSWFRHLDRERRRAALDRPRRARRHGSHAREGQLAALSRRVTPAFDGFPSITCPPGQRICWYTTNAKILRLQACAAAAIFRCISGAGR